VKLIKANKHQCLRLSERINITVAFLDGKQLGDELSKPMRVASECFARFLQKLLHFINTFTNAGLWKLLWKNKEQRLFSTICQFAC
jgi:hypothetical protein